jgi:hypothetical protein
MCIDNQKEYRNKVATEKNKNTPYKQYQFKRR